MIIYQAKNTQTGWLYVGLTSRHIEARKREHLKASRGGSPTLFHQALREFGHDVFEWSVLDTAVTCKALCDYERRWITGLKAMGHNLYNMNEGGTFGCGQAETLAVITRRISTWLK